MARARQLRERVAFEKRLVVSDGYGNEEGEFAQQFEAAAAIQVKFGGESVLAARLQGQKTATITVRQSAATLTVTEAWRIRDMRDGVLWNIRSGPVDPDDGRQWLEFLCQSGGAA